MYVHYYFFLPLSERVRNQSIKDMYTKNDNCQKNYIQHKSCKNTIVFIFIEIKGSIYYFFFYNKMEFNYSCDNVQGCVDNSPSTSTSVYEGSGKCQIN